MKAVIFDQDGLMFDTEKLYNENWHKAGEKLGLKVDDTFCNDVSGSSGAGMMAIILKHFPGIEPEPFWEMCLNGVLETIKTYLPEKKGLYELLAYLKDHDYKIAVASSSSREQIKHNLVMKEIDCYFDAIVAGHEVEHSKPAPDIFLEAAKRLGVDPKECFVLEDSFNGVMAGHQAGCHTIMVPDMKAPTKEIAAYYDACLNDLLEAKDYIDTFR